MPHNVAHLRLAGLLSQLQPMQCAEPEATERTAEVLLAAWSTSSDLRRPAEVEALQHVQTLSDALAVSSAMARSPQTARLGGLAGYKAGWKGAFPEQHELYGPLFAGGFIQHGGSASLSLHKVFSCEAEFGLVFGRRLEARDSPYSETEVLAAVDHVELCIELCSCRQWTSVNKLHYVADGLLSGGVVRGPHIPVPKDLASWPHISVRLEVPGDQSSTGDARNNPYDSPVPSATFIVNDLCVKHHTSIEAGCLIITGHCCQLAFADRPCPPHTAGGAPLAQWKEGDSIRAEFDGLGVVEAMMLK